MSVKFAKLRENPRQCEIKFKHFVVCLIFFSFESVLIRGIGADLHIVDDFSVNF